MHQARSTQVSTPLRANRPTSKSRCARIGSARRKQWTSTVGLDQETCMNEVEQAEHDRLKHENEYLMSRVIETNLSIQKVLAELRETFSGLQALEKIKLLKASELSELFQCSDNRVYELVRTRG